MRSNLSILSLSLRENVVGWFDRLAAPVTYYFDKDGIVDLPDKTGYKDNEVVAHKEADASWVIRAFKKGN